MGSMSTGDVGVHSQSQTQDENEVPNMTGRGAGGGAREKTGHSRAVKDGASDNVYRKLSVINGEINKMSRQQLQERLADLKKDTRGVNDVLKKRLKLYYRQRKLMKANVCVPSTKPMYDFLLVIDFEATCEADTTNYPHEIIEFPIILVDVHQNSVVDEFHSFCRPVLNPQLSEFCTELTGITQTDVDASEEFPAVFQRVEEWMREKHLGEGNKFAVVTDGPWDVSRFLCLQCQHSDHLFPRWAKKWINIRKTYGSFYKCGRKKLEEMLIYLGMKFEGKQHSGRDDSRNIARIAIRLIEDGCKVKVNDFIHNYPGFKFLKFSNLDAELTDSDAEDVDDKLTEESKDVKKKGVKVQRSAHVDDRDVSSAMTRLCINDKREESEEDVSDLMTYYKIQKS
ncbi:3'-5' exoribonuclease 1-like [Mizuhopecten yessoensis]|uniref:3'-5' exoribonuclease 1 n=1 Tax=Mizuhopecten yessoensis TaxID=6573 RepID=A0A210QD22_MIZYE|nr:3'-5' exoribonuclease 1-like [Mizuhopecten yessoensis]XP_021361230.1 3'-5' exoribonuclease 1-like [Mizuhopecten yessoensis]OWF46663.1 3'-5' exoribonuclease 1 [Mizuhopecten yessoensis]